MRFRRAILISLPIILLLIFWLTAVGRKPSLELTGFEEMTLYSIDPSSVGPGEKSKEGEMFRNYSVLGKFDVAAADKRTEIAKALNKAVAERGDSRLKCFEPRHGIRATDKGETRDFLICFECLNMEVFGRSGVSGSNITEGPKGLLNKLLMEAQIKLAPE